MEPLKETICSGFCTSCSLHHTLSENRPARQKAFELMEQFDRMGSIDIFSDSPDSRYTTAPLFEEPRGKMFGVLHGQRRNGDDIFLYAFSGQYAAAWLISGWVPPLFDPDQFATVNDSTEKKIKKITFHIEKQQATIESNTLGVLKKKRKKMSQQLMLDIHSLYQLHNFRGECKTLKQAYIHQGGIPTGCGDCCAPKLLNAAAIDDITPLGLTEFYWGRENRSGSKQHKHFYPSCKEKCSPILGFLLCGIELKREDR